MSARLMDPQDLPHWDANLWRNAKRRLHSAGCAEVANAMTVYSIRYRLGSVHKWPADDVERFAAAQTRLAEALQ